MEASGKGSFRWPSGHGAPLRKEPVMAKKAAKKAAKKPVKKVAKKVAKKAKKK
jgi:hypothetical protein